MCCTLLRPLLHVHTVLHVQHFFICTWMIGSALGWWQAHSPIKVRAKHQPLPFYSTPTIICWSLMPLWPFSGGIHCSYFPHLALSWGSCQIATIYLDFCLQSLCLKCFSWQGQIVLSATNMVVKWNNRPSNSQWPCLRTRFAPPWPPKCAVAVAEGPSKRPLSTAFWEPSTSFISADRS